ncbi:MAG: acyl-CoA synthetase [Acidimicrobiales bacterium]|jgi:long-chain acyl-CoA synthetase|nr:acyl-CoA synthetase [Acidimicrobiales bacterium]
MAHLRDVAARAPDRAAVVMGDTGTVVTYAELDRASNRLAHLLRAAGLARGDHYAVFAENHPRYLEVVAAGDRSGLYCTPINSHLTADELAYILTDSGARVLVTTEARQPVAAAAVARCPSVERVLVLDPDGGTADVLDGFERYADAVARQPSTPLADESLGVTMVYSSGTTGQPKGVKRPLPQLPFDADLPMESTFRDLYGCRDGDVYLSPAPLYHTAPLGFCMILLRLGATIVVMERFDAAAALRLIEQHRVTFAQWVPTHFVRMLKLPDHDRAAADVSSLRAVVHAAAPCPVEVKERIIDWWGPIVCEYYGGSEANGITFITAEEWLAHKGSVGRGILGRPVILDDDGRELPTGEIGNVYFADGAAFAYHNDDAKTAGAKHASGATTIGDVGYVDDDGYLYLTDRKAYTIISGGVNVYPQEAEDVLVLHPAVTDVAVFGVPDPEMGEQVKAVVQPAAGAVAGPDLERELIAFCRERLAHYKCPVSCDFLDQLPRLDTGKLYKRALRDRYWQEVLS